MKQRFVLFAALLPAFFIQAQTRDLVADSTWITNEAGKFFENHIQIFSDGSQENGWKRLIGDTAKVVARYTSRIEQAAEQIANDAAVVAEFPSKVKELIRQGQAIKAQIGASPLDSIQAKYARVLTDSAYQIKFLGAQHSIEFTVNAQGVLRYRLDTLQAKQAILLGRVLRLNNFNGGTDDLVLYQYRDFYYINIDRSVIMRLVGVANKSAVQPSARSGAQPVMQAKQKRKTKKQ